VSFGAAALVLTAAWNTQPHPPAAQSDPTGVLRARAEVAYVTREVQRLKDERSHGLVALPILFTAPESGVGIGAFGLYYWHMGDADHVRPSQVRSAAIITTKGQLSLDFGPTLWLEENRFQLNPFAAYLYFPQRYFGQGNTVDTSKTENYTERKYTAAMSMLTRIVPNTYLGLRYFLESHEISDREPGRVLAGTTVRGNDGGRISSIGPRFLYDSRDNVYAPSEGLYLDVAYHFVSPALGSDFEYHRLFTDARTYFAFSGGEVLSFQLNSSFMTGDVPFFAMSSIGGSFYLRGVYQNRFIELNSVQGQVDFRYPIFGRFWGSFFFGAGEVMRRIDSFAFSDLHPAGGAGLRYRIVPTEKIGIRLDFAYAAEGGTAYYLDIGEAF
jgi:outer membrane protein assembly factor BamA